MIYLGDQSPLVMETTMQEKLNEYLNILEKKLNIDLESCALDIQNLIERKENFDEFEKTFKRYQEILQSLNVIKYLRGHQANEQG